MKREYGSEPWREPETEEGDIVLFSEHGRILDNVDYQSHWLMLVNGNFHTLYLLVKHGGGQERIGLGYHSRYWKQFAETLATMTSDARYLMLYAIYDLQKDAGRREYNRGINEMKRAFVEGRLKKQKVRGENAYKVKVDAMVS